MRLSDSTNYSARLPRPNLHVGCKSQAVALTNRKRHAVPSGPSPTGESHGVKLRSPRDFVLGIVAFGGVVVTGILLFFTAEPTGGPGPRLLWTLGMITGGALMLFGGIMLLTKGIKMTSLG